MQPEGTKCGETPLHLPSKDITWVNSAHNMCQFQASILFGKRDVGVEDDREKILTKYITTTATQNKQKNTNTQSFQQHTKKPYNHKLLKGTQYLKLVIL